MTRVETIQGLSFSADVIHLSNVYILAYMPLLALLRFLVEH
jgi:hypothetical protein